MQANIPRFQEVGTWISFNGTIFQFNTKAY